MYVVRNIVGQGVMALTLEFLTQELERISQAEVVQSM